MTMDIITLLGIDQTIAQSTQAIRFSTLLIACWKNRVTRSYDYTKRFCQFIKHTLFYELTKAFDVSRSLSQNITAIAMQHGRDQSVIECHFGDGVPTVVREVFWCF